MAIGARDVLDQRLTAIYANVQTVNFEKDNRVEPDQVIKGLSMMAMANRAMLNLSPRKACI